MRSTAIVTPIAVTAGYRCPVCEHLGHWRRGVHFEHEMICMSLEHEHSVVWEPGHTYIVSGPFLFELTE